MLLCSHSNDIERLFCRRYSVLCLCHHHCVTVSHLSVYLYVHLSLVNTRYCCTDRQCLTVLQSADWVVFNTHQQLELMRVTCGGWRRPFAFHCASPANLVFTYHQPRIGTTHVHCRRPARPRLTPTPAQGGVQPGPTPATTPALSTACPDSVADSSSAAYFRDHGQAAQLASDGNSAGGVVAQQGVQGGRASEQGTRIGAEDGCGMSEPDGACVGGSDSQSGGGQGGGGEPVTSLHAVHHGREVLCCALLPPAQSQHAHQTDRPSSHSHTSHLDSSDSRSLLNQAPELPRGELEDCSMQLQEASPLCLLTGSEDGTMRQLLYCPPAPSGTPPETPFETPSGAPHTAVSQLPRSPSMPSAAKSSSSSSNMKSPPASHMQGRAEPVSNTTEQGRAGSVRGRQGKAVRESCDRQQKGLYGADEVGFQAAGSAVKSIVAMCLGPGRHSVSMHSTV